MNNLTLDQKAGVDTIAVVNTATKVYKKTFFTPGK
jgi:hypothetical protein